MPQPIVETAIGNFLTVLGLTISHQGVVSLASPEPSLPWRCSPAFLGLSCVHLCTAVIWNQSPFTWFQFVLFIFIAPLKVPSPNVVPFGRVGDWDPSGGIWDHNIMGVAFRNCCTLRTSGAGSLSTVILSCSVLGLITPFKNCCWSVCEYLAGHWHMARLLVSQS